MKRLYNLDAKEVSLVGTGANKKKFLIFKSLKGKHMQPSQEIMKLLKSVDPKQMEKLEKVIKGMASGEMPPKKDSATFKAEEGQGMSDHAQAALKAVGRILAPHKDEIHGGHLKAVGHEMGIQDAPTEAADEKTPADEMEKSQMAIPEKVQEEHHAEALDMAKKAYKSHLEKMGYQKYPEQQPKVGSKDGVDKMKDDDEDDEEEESVGKTAVHKSDTDLSAFSKEQSAQLELIFKSNKELVQKNVQLEKELKVERDNRVMNEFKERAQSFKHLGANTDELATVLKSLSESDKASFEKVESILKAADEQISQGDLYKEYGTRASGTGNKPEDQLDALVNQVVAKSDGKSTHAEMYEKVLSTPEGQRLYAEMKKSRPGGI